MPSDLSILDAEEYDVGIHFPSSKAKSILRSRYEDGPRKRAKTSSITVTEIVDDQDAEDETKRARGRPRLDTKDETAADVSVISRLRIRSLHFSPASHCWFSTPYANNILIFNPWSHYMTIESPGPLFPIFYYPSQTAPSFLAS